MKQHEAVIQVMEHLGGFATLGQLYEKATKVPGSKWGTRTPFHSIRRIVQLRPEIYKIKPGLYGLRSRKRDIESRGVIAETETNKESKELKESNHSYYQGLLLSVGCIRNYSCWVPNQDQNKPFLDKTLGSFRGFQDFPSFSYPKLVQRSQTIDVIWFNERKMPHSFFEVEHSTDIQNSLLKFNDLQDFNVRMRIVSSSARKKEYEQKRQYAAFRDIQDRLKFLDYDWLVKEYEHSIESSRREDIL